MAEDNCPQVFVVDRPASYVQLPIKQKPLWKRASKSFLLLLLTLVMLGLVVEGIFIYRLHKKTETFSLHLPYPLCQNQSSPITAVVDGIVMGRVGPEVSNELPMEPGLPKQVRERPMAHLQGSEVIRKDGVVQWVKNNDGFNNHIGYNNSGLLIEKKGYYYLYSKVHIQETQDCVVVNHKIFKNTTGYDLPIALMKSTSLHCQSERTNQKKEERNLWNSFLAGIFLLETGDLIFVTLDKGLYPGPADNFLGAFMMM